MPTKKSLTFHPLPLLGIPLPSLPMDTHNSFSLNPNLGMADELGAPSTNEGFYWESHLWPFGNFDQSTGQATSKFSASGVADVPVSDDSRGASDLKRKGKEIVVGDKSAEVVVVKEKKADGDGPLGGKGKRKTECRVESHIHTERERRKRMRTMFANLHDLLPELPSKVDKTAIVDEAVKQIQTLEAALKELEEQKADGVHRETIATVTYELASTKAALQKAAGGTTRESFMADHAASPNPLGKNPSLGQMASGFQTWTSRNVVLNILGEGAHILIRSPKRPGFFTSVLSVLEKHKIEVDSACISSDEIGCCYMINTIYANGAAEQSPGTSAERVYKEATRDLMQLLP